MNFFGQVNTLFGDVPTTTSKKQIYDHFNYTATVSPIDKYICIFHRSISVKVT